MTKGRREIKRDERTVDDMIALLSHDLRSPVRALIEVASWIEDDLKDLGTPLPGEFQSHVDLLRSRAARVQALVQDMTNYTRVGRSRMAFDGNWAQLLDPIQKDIDALVNFDLDMAFSATPDIGHSDLALLLEVLLSNACKHHDTGKGRISLTATPIGDGVEIKVVDDGPGIPEDMRDRAIGLLTTLQSRDIVEGSGMGLAIAYRIAGHYGADLQIGAPTSGTGCVVTCRLPNRPTQT